MLQLVVQLPQKPGLFWRFLQTPEQSVSPLGQVHALLEQSLPPVHFVPQAPQWLASDFRSRQAPEHSVCPGGQETTHWLFTHRRPELQAFEQALQ